MRRFVSLLVFILGSGAAQAWTVQVAAYTNEADAEAQLLRLEPLQMGHYLERSGGVLRVRVGCFFEVETARLAAEQVRTAGFTEADIGPLTAGLRPRACITRSPGFVPPPRWGTYQPLQDGLSFWVELGGRTRFISYSSLGWRVSQDGAGLALATSGAEEGSTFTQQNGTVLYRTNQNLRVAQGQLLWQSGRTALILESDTVSAYTVTSYP